MTPSRSWNEEGQSETPAVELLQKLGYAYVAPEELEEERRLFYVGITRAKDRLYLVHTFRRALFGRDELSEPSRFLADIPSELLQGQELGEPPSLPTAASDTTRFQDGDRVRHPQFGEGVVLNSKALGDDEEVTVIFVSVGIKRCLVGFAGMEKA